jgi:hypothetical protein
MANAIMSIACMELAVPEEDQREQQHHKQETREREDGGK